MHHREVESSALGLGGTLNYMLPLTYHESAAHRREAGVLLLGAGLWRLRHLGR